MPNLEFRRTIDAILKILLVVLFAVILVVFAAGYRMPPAYAKYTYPVFYLAVLAGVIYQLRSCYLLLKTPTEKQKLIGPMFWVALMGFFSLTHFIDLMETGSPTDKNFFLYLAPLFAVQSFLTLLESLLKPTAIPRSVADFDGPGFVVILEAYAASRKIEIIKVVRQATGLGLKEAKDLVEAAPKAVKKYLSQESAEEFKQLLEEAGATVRIEATTGL